MDYSLEFYRKFIEKEDDAPERILVDFLIEFNWKFIEKEEEEVSWMNSDGFLIRI